MPNNHPPLRCLVSHYARYGLRRGGRVDDWVFVHRSTFRRTSASDIILIACRAGFPVNLSAKLGHFKFIA